MAEPWYRVAWSRQRPDGKRRQAESPALSRSDANHWRSGDEIAAYIHPSDPEFAEADSDIGRVASRADHDWPVKRQAF